MTGRITPSHTENLLREELLFGIIRKENFALGEKMLAEKPMPPKGMTIKQLLWLCGGRAVVAEACGIPRLQWTTTVPDRHVMKVAELAKLPIEAIRPDLAGAAEVLRTRAGKAA